MSPQPSPSNRDRFVRSLLPVTVLLTLLWWVAGWVMPSPPSWWGVPFVVGVILVGAQLWIRARQHMRLINEVMRQHSEKSRSRETSDASYREFTLEKSAERSHHSNVHFHPSETETETESSPTSPLLIMKAITPGPIRAFASIADGIRHGWVFEDPVGTYGGDTLFNIARRPFHMFPHLSSEEQGSSNKNENEERHEYFVFDGLSKHGLSLSESSVTFGHMRYRKVDSLSPTL